MRGYSIAAVSLIMVTGVLLPVLHAAAEMRAGWTPVRDSVYLQEVGQVVKTERAARSVAWQDGTLYVGMDAGLFQLDGTVLTAVPGSPAGPLHRLRSTPAGLLVFAEKALHRLQGGTWQHVADGTFADACVWEDAILVASRDRLFRLAEGALAPLTEAVSPGPIRAIAVHAETLYCLGFDRIFLFDGVQFETEHVAEFGGLASKDLRAFASVGNRIVIGMHQGVGLLRGSAVTHLIAGDGLPFEECTAVARGFSEDVWVGTTQGAIRVLPGEMHAFSADRWLPRGQVNDVAVAPDERGAGTVAIATDGGVGLITYVPYTLEKKAAYYEQHLEAWAQKRGAFTHKLEWNAASGKWMREVSDNDVGWSTHYWAANAFKFAVTGDPVAKERAIAGFNTLKWSEEISTIDGFPARSVWAVGETGHQTSGGSGGYAAEWHPTPDGLWEWKGDTSSDELDAHFYYATIFHDLVADERLKAKAADHVARIADHIIQHGWTLTDVDGLPTVWGRWDPAYFQSLQGFYAKGLNGLGVLSYMRTAGALSGAPRFDGAVKQLVDMGYAPPVLRQKLTSPEAFVNHSDDRLAFYNYFHLLRHETDPVLRSIYRRSLERSWAIERIEFNPWFNFIYGALTRNECEVAASVAHLRAWPLDLVNHAWDFKSRTDIFPPPGHLPYAGVEKAFSPRERGPLRWSESPDQLEGGSGHEVVDPSGWLDAYWMGRYFGMILPPETSDPALLTVPPMPLREDVVPYDGPPMPNILE
jgi:hypothetical protein